MNKNKKKVWATAIVAILALIAILCVYIFLPNRQETPHNGISVIPYPTAFPSENPFIPGFTPLAEAEISVPTIEIEYIQNRDITGLQQHLDQQAQNWLNFSLNVHSLEMAGVGTSTQKAEGFACGNDTTLDDILCRYAIIEYTTVYKGITTGGVNSDFVLRPQISLKEDWSETSRITVGNKTTIVMGSTVILTFTGNSCVTSTEENTPILVDEGQIPPSDRSYTVKSLDERRLWPDVGPYIFPTGINEELLRIDSQRKAKTAALSPDHIALLLDYVYADMGPSGPFIAAVSTTYNSDTAQLFGVKGFEFVVNLTRGDLTTRCDGTPVLR